MDTFPQGSETQHLTGTAGAMDEPSLVDALLDGDELAFVGLLDRYHGSMLRLAMIYVRDHSVAEEVVQETWVGVLHGLRRFERRSSLKTWIFRILTNQAKTRGKRESLSVPFSLLWDEGSDISEPSLDPSRFRLVELGGGCDLGHDGPAVLPTLLEALLRSYGRSLLLR